MRGIADHIAAVERTLDVRDYVLSNGVADRLRTGGEPVIVTPGGHTGPAEAPAPIAAAIEEVVSEVSACTETV